VKAEHERVGAEFLMKRGRRWHGVGGGERGEGEEQH
jgi:hypothetical protein